MTTNSSGPTWYDLLGVAPDATPEQIKAAWRDATDKFEPGTGANQFRLFNEAADVLLNPEKRAEYDAEVGAAPAAEPVAVPEPAAAPEVVPAQAAAREVVPDPEPEPRADGGIPVATRVVAVIAALAVISLVVAAVLGVRLQHSVNTRKSSATSSAEASSVADRALTAFLSYDYRHMDADQNRTAKFMTPKYRKQFVKTFKLLTVGPDGSPGAAVKTKAVVTGNVLSTAVVDADGSKVRVLAFANQSAVKGSGSPLIFQDRIVATMVRSGGSWLIDDIQSY